MTLDNLVEMFEEINNALDLNENNIIERIKARLEEEDLDVYQEWENSGFDINHIFTTYSDPDPVEVTLLHFVAKEGHEDIVEALIANRANVK